MKDWLKNIDWIKGLIYLATILFLSYLTFVCFIAQPNQIVFGNVFIKTDHIDFGGFGSLLAGIFSPLAFLWLILNFRQQDKNLKIAEKQLEILVAEKQARREILKASISTRNCKVEKLTTADDLLLSFSLQSDKELKNCKFTVFDNKANLCIYSKFSDSYRFKEKEIGSIMPNHSFLIKLKLDSMSIKQNEYKKWVCGVTYLDLDGYEQTEKIILFFRLKTNHDNEVADNVFGILEYRDYYL